MPSNSTKKVATEIATQLERAVDNAISTNENSVNKPEIKDGTFMMISAMHSIADGQQKTIDRKVLKAFRDDGTINAEEVKRIKLNLAKNAMIDTAPANEKQQQQQTHAERVSKGK
ncbi:MAG: hypothetical protein R3D71_10585 [Rickettsiales bacterium]